MTRYSVLPRDRIFVKGYRFLSFAENIGRNIDKNMSKKLSSKYSQKLLDHAKQSATDAFKTDLIENKIADKITRVSKASSQNNFETNENEILRERYISPEERQKIIDDLRLI